MSRAQRKPGLGQLPLYILQILQLLLAFFLEVQPVAMQL